MGFFGFIWKNLTRRPARSILTMLGLAVAVMAVVALVGVSRGFEQSLSDLYTQRGVDILVQRKGGSQRVNSGIDAVFAENILQLDGVDSVDAGLMDIISFHEHNIVIVPINGWSPDAALFNDITVREGRRLVAGDERKAMVGHVLAANMGKRIGDTIELYAEPFEIEGIFESTSVYNNGAVVVLLSELQRLTGRPGKVTGFLVHADAGASEEELRNLASRIDALDPEVRALRTADFVNSVQQIQMSRAMAWVVSAIALLIGSIGMLNTMVMSVFERAKEIGVLRAIGWRKSRVVWMVMGEALLLSIGGAIVGVVCAVLLTRYLSTFPMTASIVQGRIAPEVMVQGLVIAILVGVGGAAYPAWWSANLSPLDALHKK